LNVGETLSATYQWDPQTGDRTDKSLYQWGYDTDNTESLGTPSTITTSGQIAASRALDATDMGKVIELSAKAQNARNVPGNTLTVQSSGMVTDPSIIPAINNLRISGMLDINNTLKGTYEFDAQGGDDNDKSYFEWGYRGSTASFSAQNVVPARNTVGDYKILAADLGKVIQLSVKPINGLGVEGIPKAVDSAMTSAEGNDITQLNPNGQVFDPTLVEVAVNNAKFGIADGFPRTGFKQAKFTLNSKGTGSPSTTYHNYYTWTDDASWVEVVDGIVTFTGEPTTGNGSVTITATPITGGVNPIQTYTFTIEEWFVNSGNQGYVGDANYLTACSDMGLSAEYTGFSYNQFTDRTPSNMTGAARKANAPLWNEWGRLSNTAYPGSNWFANPYRALEQPDSSSRYAVQSTDGSISSAILSMSGYVACVKSV
ncbi:MAG: hypothetical protein ACRCVE_08585, partial [Plesiomonas sp.]